MQSPRYYWPAWAERLQQWNLGAFTAWVLEAAGPLTVLGAQAFYFVSPFFRNWQFEALASMLEEQDEANAFAAYLREEISV